jgi:glycosyltransferase involved in cell wall biosynthesis
VKVHSLRSGWGGLSPLASHQTGLPLLKRRALERIAGGRSFDVIHYHNISLFGPGILRLDAGGGPALKVYTAHEYWLVCPTHLLHQYGVRPCERPFCVPCQLRAGRPLQLWRCTGLLADCCRHVDLFLAASRYLAERHRRDGFPYAFTPLPLFSEPPPEDGSATASPHPRPYFLFAGRLERLKGAEDLVRAWRECDAADLVLAGAGSQERRLRELAAGNPRIWFLGMLPFDLLSPWYRGAVALIVPSVVHETFSLVAIEALSHGTPVIVSDLGGMPEAVEQSGAGLVFRGRRELLDSVHALASSPALRRELGEKALAAWRLRWSPEVHLDRYFTLLDDAARRKFGFLPWAR